MLILERNGKLLEKAGCEQPVRHGGNILTLLFVDNVIKFLLQVRNVNFHKALAVGSSVDNHPGRALLDSADKVVAVIVVFLTSDLGEVNNGCVEGHAWIVFGGLGVFVFRCSELGR